MTDTNRTALAYIKETTWGETPSTPTLKKLPYSQDSLKRTQNVIRDNVIRSDRQVRRRARVQAGVSGDIQGDLIYGAWDEWLAAALLSDWGGQVQEVGTDIEFTAADNSINATTTDLSSFVVAGWIRVAGSADNDGYYKVVSSAAAKVVVERGTITDEAAGPSVTLTQDFVGVGTTLAGFSVERQWESIPEYALFRGVTPNQLTINAQVGQIATLTLSNLGKDHPTPDGTSVASATDPMSSNPVFDVVDGFEGFFHNDAASTLIVTQFQLQIANNLRERRGFGDLGARSLGQGTCEITGNLTAYFEDRTLLEQYLDFTATDLALAIKDEDGNAYLFEVPRLKFSDGQAITQGQDNDVMVEMQFAAELDDNDDTVLFNRFAA